MSNVTVTRKITVVSSGKERIQTAVTDADGRFVWKRVTDFAIVASIATWAYTYKYYVRYEGVQLLIWEGAKVGEGDLGERESRDFQGKWVSGKDFFEVHGGSLSFTYDLIPHKQAVQSLQALPSHSSPPPLSIFVGGEFHQPGHFPWTNGITATDAIRLAGGFTDFASIRWLKIRHWDGSREKYRLTSDFRLEQNVVLKPGDVIVNPRW